MFLMLGIFILFCTYHFLGTFLKYKHSDVEESIYEVLLHVYSQLFSWLPLSEFYTIESLLPIYECAVRDVSEIPYCSIYFLFFPGLKVIRIDFVSSFFSC